MEKHKLLSLPVARYFTAQIINGLEYLHKNNIIHRDLKPANVLLNEQYRIKLTDFGTAKILNCQDKGIIKQIELRDKQEAVLHAFEDRKWSFVGTSEYMSPEVINSENPTPMIDIWGVGILLFEMLSSRTPFRGATEYLTYNNISEGIINFSNDFHPDVVDFITKCLRLDPKERIGYDPDTNFVNYTVIKSHPFFEGIDFEKLDQSNLPSLDFVPKKKTSRSFASAPGTPKLKLLHLKPKFSKGELFSTMDSSSKSKDASAQFYNKM